MKRRNFLSSALGLCGLGLVPKQLLAAAPAKPARQCRMCGSTKHAETYIQKTPPWIWGCGGDLGRGSGMEYTISCPKYPIKGKRT
jgi:hypothetical protein